MDSRGEGAFPEEPLASPLAQAGRIGGGTFMAESTSRDVGVSNPVPAATRGEWGREDGGREVVEEPSTGFECVAETSLAINCLDQLQERKGLQTCFWNTTSFAKDAVEGREAVSLLFTAS